MVRVPKNCRPLMAVLLFLATTGGCASHVDNLREIRGHFYGGDLAAASKAIDKYSVRSKKERDVLELERAIVQLAQGKPHDAEQTLRQVRDRFDYLEQESLGEKAFSMVTDDTHTAYAGEDYEKVLIRAMLSLSNLMVDGTDSLAYTHQVMQKQQQVMQKQQQIIGTSAEESSDDDNLALAYKQVALGPYIQGMLREQTHNNYDDAARAAAMVVSWQPDFQAGHDDLRRVQSGHHSARGNGVLYVFTLVGRGPFKREVSQMPASASLLIADRILSHNMNQTLPPTIAPIRVPQVVRSANEIQHVGVSVDGQSVGSTEIITHVGKMAVEQYAAIYPRVVARAVVRRVVKKAAVYTAKESLGVERGTFASLAWDIGGVAWEATENADTRCWGLLPDSIQVMRIELPAGTHSVSLHGVASGYTTGVKETQTVQIADGRNTYLLANFPEMRMVGQMLVAER